MRKDKTKFIHKGFTLIELLVVIVIIGILATISTASFSDYFAKARDAVLASTVNEIALLIKVDSSVKWGPDKYQYVHNDDSSGKKLKDVFEANDYIPPKDDSNKCIVVGMLKPDPNPNHGDDNGFFVAAMGTQTSTDDSNEGGIIYDGTTSGRRLAKGGKVICTGTGTGGTGTTVKFSKGSDSTTPAEQIVEYIGIWPDGKNTIINASINASINTTSDKK